MKTIFTKTIAIAALTIASFSSVVQADEEFAKNVVQMASASAVCLGDSLSPVNQKHFGNDVKLVLSYAKTVLPEYRVKHIWQEKAIETADITDPKLFNASCSVYTKLFSEGVNIILGN